MNTIILRVKGGLGNQLFIYAFGKFLKKKYKLNVKYDLITGYLNNQYNHIQTNRSLLKIFFKNILELNMFEATFLYLFKKIKILRLANFIYSNREFKDELEITNVIEISSYNYYLEGYFQSYLFIESVIDEIREEIDLINYLKPDDLSKIQNLESQNSIAIQIRVNDYDVNLDKEYLERAIDTMNKKFKNAKFYLFSDNSEWCFNNLILPKNIKVFKTGNDIVDFIALTCCKNFILTVGTFGWWGAILSNNSNKLIIAPLKQKYFLNQNFYPKKWILL